MDQPIRRWWPTLALLALGLLSVEMIRRSHVDSRDLLQQTISSLDNISESRRRLLAAYVIHDRQQAGDETFAQSSAAAELRAAEYALRNWLAGRSGLVDFTESSPAPAALLPAVDRYAARLAAVREALVRQPDDLVSHRRRFAEAEQAGVELEARVRDAIRRWIQSTERAFRLRFAGWGLVLLLSLVGATYARRALRRAERGHQESESRLSRLREIAPVAIAECEADGGVVGANRMWSTFTGEPESHWIGRQWWQALRRDDHERARALWSSRQNGAELTLEAKIPRGDSEGVEGEADPSRWVLIRLGPGDDDGRRRRVVTLTDITEQRQVEEQLHHAQRMESVGRLAGGVAHDFNNLLTSIRGFATLASEAAGDLALRADLEEIERAADRGRALTRQLLTFSRRDRPDPRIVDTREIVRDLNRMLGRLVPDDVTIHLDLQEGPAAVLADPSQIEQVITNLVVNASDAMMGSGRIRIAVEGVAVAERFPGAKSEIEPGDYVLITVADNGPGIPPHVRDRIFEPFFTTKEQGKGTGLGLSTVWGIVRQSGGHVHVYSEAGQGTVFKIYLPAAEGTITPKADAVAASEQAVAAPGTVLVVEDEDAVRRLTARVLELRGWEVLEAGSGEEALRVLEGREEDVDLLVTDLMMRGLGGMELVEVLRAGGRDVPTLFVSGYAETELDLGGAPFLEKPFTPASLVRSVEAVVAESSRPRL